MSTYEDLHNAVLELGDRIRAVHLFNSKPMPTDEDLEDIAEAAAGVNKLAKEFKGSGAGEIQAEVEREAALAPGGSAGAELEAMDDTALYELAQQQDVKGRSNMDRDELIAALRE